MLKYLVFLVFVAYAQAQGLVNCNIPPNCKEPSNEFPANDQEIERYCGEMTRFQNCIDNWGKQCLTDDALKHHKQLVEKPFQFMKRICTDQTFRTDYLKEKDIILKMQTDMETCQKNMTENMKKIPEDLSKLANNACCYAIEYEECIKNLCKNKECSDNVNNIIKYVVSLEDMVTKCKSLEGLECSKSSQITYNIVLTLLTAFLITLIR